MTWNKVGVYMHVKKMTYCMPKAAYFHQLISRDLLKIKIWIAKKLALWISINNIKVMKIDECVAET
jgi:hypothetical protein